MVLLPVKGLNTSCGLGLANVTYIVGVIVNTHIHIITNYCITNFLSFLTNHLVTNFLVIFSSVRVFITNLRHYLS